uniref:GerMN domain-containing protein n=1 Tax=Schlesneria paludicola TaxID=360056 RepID=A0A7C2P9S3_9PLAN
MPVIRSCLLHIRQRIGWLAVLLAAGLSGCQPALETDSYSVGAEPFAQPPPVDSGPDAILVGMRVSGENVWFFKVSGPAETVSAAQPAVREFLAKVQFDGDQPPTWELPSGWRDLGGSSDRFTTLQLPSAGTTLEMAVSSLRIEPKTLMDGLPPSEYLQRNVNRWRRQLAAPEVTKFELPHYVSRLETEGDNSRWLLVRLQGRLQIPSGMPPGHEGLRSEAAPGGSTSAAETGFSPRAGFTADVPAAWTPGRLSSLRRAAFVVEKPTQPGAPPVEVTVIVLPADANPLLDNVNRWRRDQAGLPAVREEELAAATEPFQVAGKPATYVKAIGARESVLGVIQYRGAEAWFFKLQGPTDVVQREQARFESFVRSARYE